MSILPTDNNNTGIFNTLSEDTHLPATGTNKSTNKKCEENSHQLQPTTSFPTDLSIELNLLEHREKLNFKLEECTICKIYTVKKTMSSEHMIHDSIANSLPVRKSNKKRETGASTSLKIAPKPKRKRLDRLVKSGISYGQSTSYNRIHEPIAKRFQTEHSNEHKNNTSDTTSEKNKYQMLEPCDVNEERAYYSNKYGGSENNEENVYASLNPISPPMTDIVSSTPFNLRNAENHYEVLEGVDTESKELRNDMFNSSNVALNELNLLLNPHICPCCVSENEHSENEIITIDDLLYSDDMPEHTPQFISRLIYTD